MTKTISVLIRFYFPRSWRKILYNKYFGLVTGLCFAFCEKAFSVPKCEGQKMEHPTKVFSTNFEKNHILAYLRDKQEGGWSQVYNKDPVK